MKVLCGKDVVQLWFWWGRMCLAACDTSMMLRTRNLNGCHRNGSLEIALSIWIIVIVSIVPVWINVIVCAAVSHVTPCRPVQCHAVPCAARAALDIAGQAECPAALPP